MYKRRIRLLPDASFCANGRFYMEKGNALRPQEGAYGAILRRVGALETAPAAAVRGAAARRMDGAAAPAEAAAVVVLRMRHADDRGA